MKEEYRETDNITYDSSVEKQDKGRLHVRADRAASPTGESLFDQANTLSGNSTRSVSISTFTHFTTRFEFNY